VDIPGLTVSLRGLLEVEVTCRALHADVHSGLWGGMVPDPCVALVSLIARLVDDDGRLNVGRIEVPKQWSEAAWQVPLDDTVITKGAHLIDGVKPLPHRGRPPAEWLWRQPAVTILSTTLPTPIREKNAIRKQASAVLSIRTAPGQTTQSILSEIRDVLTDNPPGGVDVTVEATGASGQSWLYSPSGPAFDAADRAYVRAWGKPLIQVGVGGSIPFVAIFGQRFGDLPLILNGVMDPMTTAHGPNESMDLSVFRKAIAANIYLLAELGALGREGLR